MISFFSFGASAAAKGLAALRFGARKSARPCAAKAAGSGPTGHPCTSLGRPQGLAKFFSFGCSFLLLSSLVGSLTACQSAQSAENKQSNAPAIIVVDSVPAKAPIKMPPDPVPPKFHKLKDSLSTIKVAGHEVDIQLPQAPFKGSLFILPGYNFPKENACQKAPQLCQEFLEAGYLLIMPEMGRSLYSSQYFPQTQANYKQYPDQNWFIDSLIPHLQLEYALALEEQRNFIVGISTGGRGAALLALARPKLWTAIASLSGDFDQSQMPNDKLMRNFYGPYAQFSQRWKTVDNVIARIDDWQTPIFIGHGGADRIVPPSQSQQLFDSLQSRLAPNQILYSAPPTAKHNYAYWGAEAKNILPFFQSLP